MKEKWVPFGLPNPVEHTIDPATGIWPIAEWGTECGRGFVSDERFARGGDKVIQRTNRSQQRRRQQKQKGTRDG